MVRAYYFTAALLFSMVAAFGQQIVPSSLFLNDSLKIGEEVDYVVTLRYPKDWEVILPDSTHNFFPFEFISKQYFPTQLDSAYAVDSVIYTLSTFEIDPVKRLSVPIYLLNGKDSIVHQTVPDSIYLVELISTPIDSLNVIKNTEFQAINYQFNYIYFLIGLAILFVISITLFLVFGDSVWNRIIAWRLKKDFNKWILIFRQDLEALKSKSANAPSIERLLLHWKKYMQRLEDRPYAMYTTKEILMLQNHEQLRSILGKIDQSVYGKTVIEDIFMCFEDLEYFAIERYENKLKEVING